MSQAELSDFEGEESDAGDVEILRSIVETVVEHTRAHTDELADLNDRLDELEEGGEQLDYEPGDTDPAGIFQ